MSSTLDPSGSHSIDCDMDPYLPSVGYGSDPWYVIEHQKGGSYIWNKEAQKDALFVHERQAGTGEVQGLRLCQELKTMAVPVLNANVLDYLLANPDLIPEEWKGLEIFFWGTLYSQGSDTADRVCSMSWNPGRRTWTWSFRLLGYDWRFYDVAAIRSNGK